MDLLNLLIFVKLNKILIMKKFLLFSIGLSLFVGILCGNKFPKNEYFIFSDEGKVLEISKETYVEQFKEEYQRIRLLNKTDFNISIFAQTSIAVFSLSLIGYSVLKKE